MRRSVILLVACVAIGAMSMGVIAEPEAKSAPTMGAFVCPDCEHLALAAGSCDHCGKALQAKNVLGTKNGKAKVCDCSAGCTACDAKGVSEGKCACGKDVGKVSAKGHYVCPEGCAEISKTAGTCACGKAMTMVE